LKGPAHGRAFFDQRFAYGLQQVHILEVRLDGGQLRFTPDLQAKAIDKGRNLKPPDGYVDHSGYQRDRFESRLGLKQAAEFVQQSQLAQRSLRLIEQQIRLSPLSDSLCDDS